MKYKEIWKPIKGFETRYSISNYGRIKSIERYMVSIHKNARKNLMPEKILKTKISKNGYEKIKLYDGVKSRDLMIHRLVGEAFVNNPKNKPYIDHLDGNKLNNRADNLEYVTMAENNQRAYDTGLKRRIHAGQWRKGSNCERIPKEENL